MARRLWGLTRAQTVGALAAAVLVGLLIALLTSGGGGSGSSPSGLRLDHLRPGTKGDPDAVWVFGFQTLRFDPSLRHAQQVRVTGFGSVQGADGRVYLYDAGTGRVGVLDSARNDLTTLGRLPGGTPQDDTFAPTIAPTAGSLWLVSAPGRLTRFDLSTRTADDPIALVDHSGATGDPVTTGVVATGGSVLAVTRDGGGLALARVDATTGAVVARGRIDASAADAPGAADGSGVATIDGVAAEAGRLWIVASGSVFEVDATTLAVDRRTVIADRAQGGVAGAVVAAGSLYVLADNGRSLARFVPDPGRLDVVVRILPTRPSAFTTPASLVSDGTSVWAMVQRPAPAPRHAVRVAGYDARSGRPTAGVDLPGAMFAGAAAAS
jgi:hypothetical protein